MRASIVRLALYSRLVFLPVVALVAFALVAFGVSLIYVPAGFIVGGVFLVLSVIDARR